MSEISERVRAACRDGDLAALDLLLKSYERIPINAVDGVQKTALLYTIESCHQDSAKIANLLISAGADVNSPIGSATPLTYAAHWSNTQVLTVLLKSGAKIDAFHEEEDDSDLAVACNGLGDTLEAAKILIKHGANVNKLGIRTPLMYAAMLGDTHLVKLLLDSGANVHLRVKNAPSNSALEFAVARGHAAVVQQLLSAGADPNAMSPEGEFPLLMAVSNYRRIMKAFPSTPKAPSLSDTVAVLLKGGANVMQKDHTNRTALQVLYMMYMLLSSHERTDDMFKTFALLITAGDFNWAFVPMPCPQLEVALVPVWKKAPEQLPELFKRLSKEVQTEVQGCLMAVRSLPKEELRMMVMEHVVGSLSRK